VGAISGSEHVDAAEHTIGPSFDCAKLQTPLAQMICSSSELSKVDLEMVQTFNALRQQVGNSGWAALLQEAVDLQKLVLKKCNIPTVGMPPPGHGDQAICLSDEYGKQKTAWALRLDGPGTEEAYRSLEEHISLQRDLQKLGFLPAGEAIEGVYGSATRSAIIGWQRQQGLSETGFITVDQAFALEQAANGGDQAGKAQSKNNIDNCDRFAGREGDADLPAGLHGVKREDIQVTRALIACNAAINSHPGERRFIYQLGRALDAADQYELANEQFRKAIALGSGAAMASLGVSYDLGDGVENDYTVALEYYKQGASLNDPMSINNLGTLYDRGRGVDVDLDEAMTLFEKAASLGSSLAMQNIAIHYERGLGLPQDEAKALRWREMADRTRLGK
jgi:TPR repeat protein